MKELQYLANVAVLDFYKSLPFNYRDSVEEHVKSLHQIDPVASYPVLVPLLRPGVRVLEVGCGTGWLSNAIAHRYKASVTAIDFNPVAIQRAAEVAKAAGLDTKFSVADLFRYEPSELFDVVISIGVLHHTDDCAAAVRRCCNRFVKPGGHVFIGLYHRYGRRPFLDHFQEMKEAGASEERMFAEYRRLHSQLKDETLLMSWFRDQVIHPHETQHTLEEMLPVLASVDMTLVSTSINRFEPIESTQALIEEEKTYEELARKRLSEGQYFTGFYVFLAQRQGGDPKNHTSQTVDVKPYIRHHSVVGYEYVPDTDLTLAAPGGARYTIRVNSAGIRSDREYTRAKPPGVYRILVFGDSMSAGQFVSNEHRFSEILERRYTGLEVINLSLEGSGTDQQLLIFEQVGSGYEFDTVLLFPFLQNIRRNMVEAREGKDPYTLQRLLIPKPRFELVDGKLTLRNVPVPKERKPAGESYGAVAGTDANVSVSGWIKTTLNGLPGMPAVKKVVYGLIPWEPFREYKDPGSVEWRLMEAILRRFKELAGNRPLVIVPTFYSNYIRYRMARNYWDRYHSLTTTPGIYAIDLLPHFRKAGAGGLRCFQDPYDMHFSAYGQLMLADILQRELSKLGLLPR